MASADLTKLVRDLWGDGFRISRWYSSGHDGIDLPAKAGTPIRAVASGKVSFAADARRLSSREAGRAWAIGGGNVVNIDISGNRTTQYAHLQSIYVREGQYVKKGDIIGTVGGTGGMLKNGKQGGPGSTFFGPHLHFGLWDHGSNRMVNPTTFLLAARAGWSDPTPNPDRGGIGPAPATIGAWADKVQFPEGHIITQADIDHIMQVLRDEGYFPGAAGASGGVGLPGLGEYQTRYVLETYALGKPWTKSLRDTIGAQLQGQATASGSDAMLAAIFGPFADLVTKLTDPGNWIRILALFVGLAMAAYGFVGILRSTGQSYTPASI